MNVYRDIKYRLAKDLQENGTIDKQILTLSNLKSSQIMALTDVLNRKDVRNLV